MKEPVAVQFGKAAEGFVDVIERVGSLRMPRQLHALPGAEVGIQIALLGLNLLLELPDFIADIQRDISFLRLFAQFLEAALQVDVRFFEIQQVLHS